MSEICSRIVMNHSVERSGSQYEHQTKRKQRPDLVRRSACVKGETGARPYGVVVAPPMSPGVVLPIPPASAGGAASGVVVPVSGAAAGGGVVSSTPCVVVESVSPQAARPRRATPVTKPASTFFITHLLLREARCYRAVVTKMR